MNIRRACLSGLAAVSLITGVMVTSISAQQVREPQVTVNNVGEFEYRWSAGSAAYVFGVAEVSTDVGDTVMGSGSHKTITVDEYRSTSPGWIMQVEADDLVESTSGEMILQENLSVWFRQFGAGGSCPASLLPPEPYPTTQDFQDVTPITGVEGYSNRVNFASAQNLMSADDGRGCGSVVGIFQYELYVPAGTYTGDGSATYTGSLTLTNSMEVAEPE